MNLFSSLIPRAYGRHVVDLMMPGTNMLLLSYIRTDGIGLLKPLDAGIL